MDRNLASWSAVLTELLSLSARRAWIEIVSDSLPALKLTVALRKESVDRNCPGTNTILSTTVALRKESVDRNLLSRHLGSIPKVALRKESVDRNVKKCIEKRDRAGRSPQGERG